MSKKIVRISENQTMKLVSEVVKKATGKTIEINESVESKPKQKIIRLTEAEYKKMLIELSKKSMK